MSSSSSSNKLLNVIVEELHAIIEGLVGGARYGFKIRLPHALVMTTLFRRDLTAREKLKSVLRLAIEHATNLASFATIYKLMLSSFKWISRHIRSSASEHDDNPNNDNLFKFLGRTILLLIVDGPFAFNDVSLDDDEDEDDENDGGSGSYYSGGGGGGVGASQSQRATLLRRAKSMPIPKPAAPPAPPGHPETIYHSFVAGAVGGYFVWGRYSSVNYQIVLYLASRVMVALYKKGYDAFISWRIRNRRGGASSSSQQQHQSHHKNHDPYPYAAAIVWGLVMALFEESPQLLHKSLKTSMDEIYRYRLVSADNDDDNGDGATVRKPQQRQTQQQQQQQQHSHPQRQYTV